MKINREVSWLILRDFKDGAHRILMGRKKKGFGQGKLVGIGGKFDPAVDKSIEDTARREALEEVGVKVGELKSRGTVVFDNILVKGQLDCFKMTLFVADSWEGEIKSSDEIEAVWQDVRELDYSACWEDTIHWLPYVLADESVEAYFKYTNGSEIAHTTTEANITASTNANDADATVSGATDADEAKQKIDFFKVDLIPGLEIAHITDEDFGLEASTDTTGYFVRPSARIVLLDDKNRVALIRADNSNYYSLPGGGIEKDEFIREALHREAREETGYLVEILDELGVVREDRKDDKRVNIGYCYLCRAKDFVGTELTEDEIADGYELEWFDDIDEAISALESLDLDSLSYQHRYVVLRAINVLHAAVGLIRGKYGG